MTITETPLFDRVRDVIHDTHLIAFDGCHKIYLALDEMEADWFRENYENVLEDTPEAMLAVLGVWWEQSCSLRFINGVRHNGIDLHASFVTLIDQFEAETKFSCVYCGDTECEGECYNESDDEDEEAV